MKKITLILAIAMSTGIAYEAQANFLTQEYAMDAAMPAITKIKKAKKVEKELVNGLSSTLDLSTEQQKAVQSYLSSYITGFNSFGKLSQTNATEFSSKLNGHNSGLRASLKGILSNTQFNTLTNLGNGDYITNLGGTQLSEGASFILNNMMDAK